MTTHDQHTDFNDPTYPPADQRDAAYREPAPTDIPEGQLVDDPTHPPAAQHDAAYRDPSPTEIPEGQFVDTRQQDPAVNYPSDERIDPGFSQAPDAASAPVEPSSVGQPIEQDVVSPAHAVPAGETVPSTEAVPQAPAAVSSSGSDSSTDKALFADDQLSGLRARWTDVQSTFVDDPKECVQKADGLVSDVVEQLTASFSDARSRLEEQWARGEEASTEDLRIALKKYREFFERLLAV